MEGLACLGAEEAKKSFDTMSFLKKVGPEVVSAAEESLASKPKPTDAPTDATGKKPSGVEESWFSNPAILIGGAAVLGIGGYFLLRK